MHPTRLYTRDGMFVTEVLLPPFQLRAEIVCWGERYFVWNEQHQQYREGMVFWVPVNAGNDNMNRQTQAPWE